MQGTWKSTSSGDGGGTAACVVLALFVVLGSGAAAARILGDILIAAAITGSVLILTAAGLLAWWIRKLPAREARAAEAYAAPRLALEADRRARALEQHQRRLELAAASAPVINNVIDPAALFAAFGTIQSESAPVIRGEVEK